MSSGGRARAHEFNFDGLVGPTHNYAGLSPGNLASAESSGRRSNPRKAALQGLAKMAKLHALGVPQAVLPPHPRPDLDWLRRLGFTGNDARVVERTAREAPRLLAAAYSASSMWTANAATVIPSADASDGRLHFIPANLSSQRHRSLEPPCTSRLLRALFPNETFFAHHEPVPIAGDEGAANHVRLCTSKGYGAPGIELFVYGTPTSTSNSIRPQKYPARQSETASRAVARLGALEPEHTIFLQQNPRAIDAGVFHNDVIATGDRNLLLVHEDAFLDQRREIDRLREAFARLCGEDLRVIEIPEKELSLSRAVGTYLFNCQIVVTGDGRTAWIGPLECKEDAQTDALLDELASPSGPFDELHFVDLRESMRNGGGPACLRLRVVLDAAQRAESHGGVFFDDALHARLAAGIERHYRDVLDPEDLADPALIGEARTALDAIMQAVGLGSVYA